MTRQDSHKRSLYFSQWLRDNLPDSSTGTYITDIDFVIFNWKSHNRMLFVEEKTHGADMTTAQRNVYKKIVKALQDSGIQADCAFVKFENTSFEDGRVWINNQEVTEDMIKKTFTYYS